MQTRVYFIDKSIADYLLQVAEVENQHPCALSSVFEESSN